MHKVAVKIRCELSLAGKTKSSVYIFPNGISGKTKSDCPFLVLIVACELYLDHVYNLWKNKLGQKHKHAFIL